MIDHELEPWLRRDGGVSIPVSTCTTLREEDAAACVEAYSHVMQTSLPLMAATRMVGQRPTASPVQAA